MDKELSDNTLKCEKLATIESVSNSSTSETLIDIQINPSQSSELTETGKNVVEVKMMDDTDIKEDVDSGNVNICITTTDTALTKESVAEVAIPSTKSEKPESSKHDIASERTVVSNSEKVKSSTIDTNAAEDNWACDSFDVTSLIKTSSSGHKLMRAQTVSCSRDASPSR